MKNKFSVSFAEGLDKVKFGFRFTFHKKKSAEADEESKVETELFIEPELKQNKELPEFPEDFDFMQEE